VVNQHNGSNLDPDMTRLNLTPDEVDALVKFMEVGLTDPRVAWERAPFDHPSLVLAQGDVGDENSVGQKPAVRRSLPGRRRMLKSSSDRSVLKVAHNWRGRCNRSTTTYSHIPLCVTGG
jgi:hypothetical protein